MGVGVVDRWAGGWASAAVIGRDSNSNDNIGKPIAGEAYITAAKDMNIAIMIIRIIIVS